MPGTGEDREIRGRINAREAEIAMENSKLRQKSGSKYRPSQEDPTTTKKKPTKAGGNN